MSLTLAELSKIKSALKKQFANIKTETGWKNFCETIYLPNTPVFDVQDILSLQTLLRTIHAMNQNKNPDERIIVRVAAGDNHDQYNASYSLTEGARADIIIRLTGDEFRCIEKTDAENIMHVGGSWQIGELEKELYEQYNLVMPTSSLIPYVTVAGLSANAGHGTGKNMPSFSGLFRSMTFMLPNGDIKRIDATHPDFETIRGAHLGVFGVLLHVEMECIPAKKLQRITEAVSVPVAIEKISDGLFFQEGYVSLMYTPTYYEKELTQREDNNVLISHWAPVDLNVPNIGDDPGSHGCLQKFQINIQEHLKITDRLRQFPDFIPYYMRKIIANTVVGDGAELSVSPWPSVHHQQAFPHKMNDFDCLFETSDNSEAIIAAFTKVVTVLDEAKMRGEAPVDFGVYIRVFKGTNGGLSTSHKINPENYICALDVVSSTPPLPGYEKFRDVMIEFFLTELNATLHWGKYAPADIDYESIYGDNFREFRHTLERWYDEHGIDLGKCMFLNTYLNKILKLPFEPAEMQEIEYSRACFFKPKVEDEKSERKSRCTIL